MGSKNINIDKWWVRHSALLAAKMKLSGVKDFRISLTDRGTYEFEVNPVVIESKKCRRNGCDNIVKVNSHGVGFEKDYCSVTCAFKDN